MEALIIEDDAPLVEIPPGQAYVNARGEEIPVSIEPHNYSFPEMQAMAAVWAAARGRSRRAINIGWKQYETAMNFPKEPLLTPQGKGALIASMQSLAASGLCREELESMSEAGLMVAAMLLSSADNHTQVRQTSYKKNGRHHPSRPIEIAA